MNAAKIQLSSGHNEGQAAGGEPIYHNIKTGWEISAEEQALVADAGWIITKNAIIAKVLVLFGELSGTLQERWKEAGWAEDRTAEEGRMPVKETEAPVKEMGMPMREMEMPMREMGVSMKEILAIPPRISKGENYKGLPWVVLDYPRSFGRRDVFAVRTLFWWGNYFSVTLHLKGVYKDMFLPVIRERIPLLAAAGFFIGVSDDEWRHELGQESYRPLAGAGEQAEPGIPGDEAEQEGPRGQAEFGIPDREFLKFSAKCDLKDWNEAARHLLQLSGIVIQALGR
jgi:hypothetical protein